jgi:hypothetical protein
VLFFTYTPQRFLDRACQHSTDEVMLQAKDEHGHRDDFEGRVLISTKPSNDTFIILWFDDSHPQGR